MTRMQRVEPARGAYDAPQPVAYLVEFVEGHDLRIITQVNSSQKLLLNDFIVS